MSVEVSAASAHPAGHALIRVAGAASAVDAPGFRLHRPGWTECNLGPDGWQVAEALLQPDRATAEGGDLVLHAGPRVCAHMESGNYLFALPAAGLEDVAVWPDIAYVAPPSPAAAPKPEPPAVAPVAPAPPPPASPVIASAVGAEPAPRQTRPSPPAPPTGAARPAGRSRWPVLAAVAAVLLLAGGGGWYALHPRPGSEPGPAQATAPAPLAQAPPRPEPPSPPPLSLAGLSVPDVIARAPDVAAVVAEGERRLGSDRKDDGLLLLEAAADRGDGRATVALARLYDPNGFRPGGPIPAPDARQAARYYRDAARGGADGVAEPRAALRAMLERRAGDGDLTARLTLKDFWP